MEYTHTYMYTHEYMYTCPGHTQEERDIQPERRREGRSESVTHEEMESVNVESEARKCNQTGSVFFSLFIYVSCV